jgi:predicted Zn-dependent protease
MTADTPFVSTDAPQSLFALLARDADPARYMSRADAEALFQRIVSMTTGGGGTQVSIVTKWTGNLRWARNRITTSGDTMEQQVVIVRGYRGSSTNKLDDASLRLAVRNAESWGLLVRPEGPRSIPLQGLATYVEPSLWSGPTYELDAAARSAAARELVRPAFEHQLLAAGYAEVRATATAVFNTAGRAAYYAATRGEYSATVRNPSGTGSGWAGVDTSDWTTIDATKISATALRKCVESTDPRVIEPGRYTVILEPQAVHDLLESAIGALDRQAAESRPGPYNLGSGQSKIGLKVFDDRLSISTDPMDPECAYVPFDGMGEPYKATTWVENGVLRELAYDRAYAVTNLAHNIPQPNPFAYRVAGAGEPVPIERMIQSTKRGLLVTRLSGLQVIDGTSLYSTGVTRDGVWLIENGKIKYPIKNMRFNESPMFAFNSIEEIGAPVRVYAQSPAVVPPIKVRDFNFTSLADAI